MRILHVAHAVPPEANTGVENYTAHLAKAMTAAGHTVAIFARSLRKDVPLGTVLREEEGDILTVRVGMGSGHSFGHDRVRWDMTEAFRKFLQEWQPDVVHFQHLLYHSLNYPYLARQAGAGTVLTLHDLWFTCPTVQRLDFRGDLCNRLPGRACLPCLWSGGRQKLVSRETLSALSRMPGAGKLLDLMPTVDELEGWTARSAAALRGVDAVISPSRFVADDLKAAGIVPERLILSDYGIPRPDLPSLQQYESSRPGDELVHFGIIGSHRLKGPHVAVDAFRKLPDLPVRLHLYGTDAFPETPPNVVVEGRYTAADLERVYASFDVLIVPSIWYENAPFVIREAFARNRPVIASDIGGMKESVTDGLDGLHFKVGDSGALADAIRRLVGEPGLLERLRAGIRPPKFYDDHLGELIGLYESVRRKRGADG